MEKHLYTSNHQLFPYCSFYSLLICCYYKLRGESSCHIQKIFWYIYCLKEFDRIKQVTSRQKKKTCHNSKLLIKLYACFDIVRTTYITQVTIKNTHYNQYERTNKYIYTCVLFFMIIINVTHFRYCYSSFPSCHFARYKVSAPDNLVNCIISIFFSRLIFDFSHYLLFIFVFFYIILTFVLYYYIKIN